MLSPDAPDASKHAPPEVPEAEYRLSLGLGVAGLVLMLLGGTNIVLGVLLMLGGFGAAWVKRQQIEDAKAAKAAWDQSWYCVTCPQRFGKAA